MERAGGVLLVLLPVAFNTFFVLLGRAFQYPDILRRPTDEILSRFQAGGVTLKLLWYGFMLTAVLLITLAVLLGQVLAHDGLEIVPVATTIGVLAGVVQFLGLARWPFLVPSLARTHADPASSQATREATTVAFESFHRFPTLTCGDSWVVSVSFPRPPAGCLRECGCLIWSGNHGRRRAGSGQLYSA
jgi:hypothetical protein